MEHPHTTGDPAREGVSRGLNYRIATQGSITFPAVPALLDEYVDRLSDIFAKVGRRFNDSELAELRSILGASVQDAFDRSQRSSVTVTYSADINRQLEYLVGNHSRTIEEAYDEWTHPPTFGTAPDARVWALANETDPGDCSVLDIGAGTGRNALALARRGHRVDVVEVSQRFADEIRQSAAWESLDVRVIQRDVFAATDELRDDYSLIFLAEVVPEFRTVEQLRFVFELAARCLAPGGRLLFNTFLTRDGYVPDDAARQFAQQAYSSFFTRAELDSAAEGLPLRLEDDVSVFEFERANLPEGAWPPTSWFENWCIGHDVFFLPREASPIDLRWLVYRREN